MRDDQLTKATQTIVFVSPNIYDKEQEDLVKVRCIRGIQTEAQFDCNIPNTACISQLEYTPFSDIARDAQRISDLPRKVFLKFSEEVTEYDGHTEEDTSGVGQCSSILQTEVDIEEEEEEDEEIEYQPPKSSLKRKIVYNQAKMEEKGIQTNILVRPHILQENQVAFVVRNADAQTSATFTPNTSITQVADTLHKYAQHTGHEIGVIRHAWNVQENVIERTSEEITTTENIDTDPTDTTDQNARHETVVEGKDDTLAESTKRDSKTSEDTTDRTDPCNNKGPAEESAPLNNNMQDKKSSKAPVTFISCTCKQDPPRQVYVSCECKDGKSPGLLKKTCIDEDFINKLNSETARVLSEIAAECECRKLIELMKSCGADSKQEDEEVQCGTWCKDPEEQIAKHDLEFDQSNESKNEPNISKQGSKTQQPQQTDINSLKEASKQNSKTQQPQQTDIISAKEVNEETNEDTNKNPSISVQSKADTVNSSAAASTKQSENKESKERETRCKQICHEICSGEEVEEEEIEEICAPPKKRVKRKIDINQVDIKAMCKSCCTEEEVIARLQELYESISDMFEEDEESDAEEEENLIEQKIIDAMEITCEKLEDQLKQMVDKYGDGLIKDAAVQNDEFAGHIDRGDCTQMSGRQQMLCECGCDQLDGQQQQNVRGNLHISHMVQTITLGLGKHVYSSPVLIIREEGSPSADLANEAVRLPLNARGCTKRFCHCGMSDGKTCKRCDTGKMDLRKLKTSPAGQNIDLLIDLDAEYADSYLEVLEQDTAGTQTEIEDEEGNGQVVKTPKIPQCGCMRSVEIPWDLITLAPPPKRKPAEPLEEPTQTDLPAEITPSKARLNKLAVEPMDKQLLLDITNEFLEDPLAEDGLDVDAIEKQIMEEAEKNADTEQEPNLVAEDTEDEETMKRMEMEKRCKERPKPKPRQVFNPECERHNEPYMDRMYRFIEDDCATRLSLCSSHIEMPWEKIEIPKQVTIRRCIKKKTQKAERLCTPESRLKKRQQTVQSPVPGVHATPQEGHSRHGIDFRLSITEIASSKLLPVDGPARDQLSINTTFSNILYAPKKSPKSYPIKGSFSQPHVCSDVQPLPPSKGMQSKVKMAQDPLNPVCETRPILGKQMQSQPIPTTTIEEKQSRNERIALLLESCKREMEPIKDGINQLRNRIRELNLPDFFPPELPQRPGPAGAGLLGLGSYSTMMPPDMYAMHPFAQAYSPYQMSYPYASSMYPTQHPGIPMQQTASHHLRKCKCRLRNQQRKMTPKSSSYNSSSGPSSEVPSEVEDVYVPVQTVQPVQMSPQKRKQELQFESQRECHCGDDIDGEEDSSKNIPSSSNTTEQQQESSKRSFNKPSRIPKRCAFGTCDAKCKENEISKPGEIQKYSGKYFSKGMATNKFCSPDCGPRYDGRTDNGCGCCHDNCSNEDLHSKNDSAGEQRPSGSGVEMVWVQSCETQVRPQTAKYGVCYNKRNKGTR